MFVNELFENKDYDDKFYWSRTPIEIKDIIISLYRCAAYLISQRITSFYGLDVFISYIIDLDYQLRNFLF